VHHATPVAGTATGNTPAAAPDADAAQPPSTAQDMASLPLLPAPQTDLLSATAAAGSLAGISAAAAGATAAAFAGSGAEPASSAAAASAPSAPQWTPIGAAAAPAAPSADDAGSATPSAPAGGGHCAACCPGACGTLEFNGPLGIVGQHPPSTLFYEPMPDVATVLAPGGKTVSADVQLTNNIIRELDSGVVVDYDFESLRLTLDYRQRLGAGDLGVRLPVDYRSQGFLDPVIANWHQFFGLHNGLRSTYPDYQYHYTIITRDGLVYNGTGDVLGLGDLALSYKYPLWDHRDGHDAAAVRLGLKAPTGSSTDALGSGNWDYSVGALWQRQFTPHLRGYVNLDYVRTGAVDWPNIRQHNITHTLWGAEYAWSPRFSLVTQYSTETNALITGSYEADKDPRELTVGFNHRIGPHVVWSGGFREDISPETAPDFGVLSNFKWQF
jgi:hypothetical protein